MRRFITLFCYQLHLMAISFSTYAAAFLFLSFMALMYLVGLVEISVGPSRQSPTELFLSIFWVPVLFLVPLITMKSLSEERRMGTLGTLMTTPVSAWQIVLSKFLACYFFYVILWVATLAFPLITAMYMPRTAVDARIFDIWQIGTGYAFIFVSGTMYVAVGIFASSLTRSTLVSGMLSFCMLFFAIIGSGLLSNFPLPESGAMALLTKPAEYMQTFKHLEDFSMSIMDTRPFFFYLSTALLLLSFTSLITESKNA